MQIPSYLFWKLKLLLLSVILTSGWFPDTNYYRLTTSHQPLSIVTTQVGFMRVQSNARQEGLPDYF
jgi:hypothetical protein